MKALGSFSFGEFGVDAFAVFCPVALVVVALTGVDGFAVGLVKELLGPDTGEVPVNEEALGATGDVAFTPVEACEAVLEEVGVLVVARLEGVPVCTLSVECADTSAKMLLSE